MIMIILISTIIIMIGTWFPKMSWKQKEKNFLHKGGLLLLEFMKYDNFVVHSWSRSMKVLKSTEDYSDREGGAI